MANKRGTDAYTKDSGFGANFIYSQGAGGLWDILDHFQAGKIYLASLNATTATGTFEKAWTSATDPNCITITPRINPSGAFWISAMSNTGFTVTFATSPYNGGTLGNAPFYVADWFACM